MMWSEWNNEMGQKLEVSLSCGKHLTPLKSEAGRLERCVNQIPLDEKGHQH